MADDCLVCREVSGQQPVPGGHLQSDDELVAFHLPILPPATDVFAGYLLISPRRHAAGFADLDDDEAAEIGRAIARWSRALESAGAEHVYALRIGHGVPHLHVHLVPRWPGTPADVSWLHSDDWDGARRCDEIGAAAVADDLRRADRAAAGPAPDTGRRVVRRLRATRDGHPDDRARGRSEQ